MRQIERSQMLKAAVANPLNCQTAYAILAVLIYALGFFSALYHPAWLYERPPPAAPTPNFGVSATKPGCAIDSFRITTRCGDPIPPELVRPTILHLVFNGTSPYTGFPPPYAATLLRRRRIKGWGSSGAVFENLINRVKPQTIVEVGTFLGASAIHMANLTRRHGLETHILCIDDFRGWPGFRERFRDLGMVNGDVLLMQQFMQNVVDTNSTGSVLPVPFSTGSALQKLCEWGVRADLIEIDAGHDFNSAWADINRAVRLLRTGGVIFGHDYFTAADNRGVRRAVDLFADIHGVKVKTDGQHWVIDSLDLTRLVF